MKEYTGQLIVRENGKVLFAKMPASAEEIPEAGELIIVNGEEERVMQSSINGSRLALVLKVKQKHVPPPKKAKEVAPSPPKKERKKKEQKPKSSGGNSLVVDFVDDSKYRILCGDVREMLKTLPEESVHCVVTSPPYYGLRRYSDDKNEIGREETPQEYVQNLVEVFREIWRVLRDDGTAWLNLGDCFAGSGKGPTGHNGIADQDRRQGFNSPKVVIPDNLKPKDLIGIPWRVAFALQDDGWYLRSDIIWHKPAPMPESVTDRPTRAHEFVFLLTKSPRYYYDGEAIREPIKESNKGKTNVIARQGGTLFDEEGRPVQAKREYAEIKGANKRSVWSVTTKPFSAKKVGVTDVDHFAVFPPDLIEPMILAGTSEKGCCPKCGSPWKRILKKTAAEAAGERGESKISAGRGTAMAPDRALHGGASYYEHGPKTEQLGWEPTCECGCEDVVPCVVLDPFTGSGTTGVVSLNHGRKFVGTELNPKYARLAKIRIEKETSR